MKGVILAGGTGSRLFPSTKVTNKHLLPVFDRPMIYYPIQTLKDSGVRDILIITSAINAGDFLKLMGSGKELGVNLTFKVQDGSGGIAQALSLAESFAGRDSVAMMLADNIFESDFAEDVMNFRSGARIFIKKVDDPERFGVVEVDEIGIVRSIEEKPTLPKSDTVQTGFFLYDAKVFDMIREIRPSDRGELEITDVNKLYLEQGNLSASEVQGMWCDAGTHESLLEASILAQEAFDPERVQLRRAERAALHSTESPMATVTVGVVTHNSEKYIIPCIQSLLAQTHENFEIVIFDNDSSDETVSLLADKFPEIRVIESEKNVGFARGHNEILRKTGSEFYACVNVDILFEQNFLAELIRVIQEKPNLGSAGGKLKFWDFNAFHAGATSEGKTNFIDTVGIRILRSHRFEDIGQGEIDCGQFDDDQKIFGISGAAALYRREALRDVAFENDRGELEYFDESMFMYKEDVDLAYRLQWAGWKATLSPLAVGYHDRTVSVRGTSALSLIKNRLKKTRAVNQQSFLNHRILLRKNFSPGFSVGTQSATRWYNFKIFLYILIFETELLGAWWKVFRMRKRINAWRTSMPRRVSQKEIEKLMDH
jgi:glucose-1-phosphate thymidylyltransferase